MGIKHTFVSNVADIADDTQIRPSNWNADHTIDGDVDFNGFDITNVGNANVLNLKDFGAVGDGIVDDTAAVQAWIEEGWLQQLATDPLGAYGNIVNKILFAPGGKYRITSTIEINGANGAVMIGAGRYATHFVGDTDVTVFKTNGCAYTRFSDFSIAASGDCDCFDLYWQQDGYISCQSNTFSNMFFSGGNTGLDIGYPNMGSENIVLNCYFTSHAGQGLKTSNFNALQNQVIGGNFASCNVGVRVGAGSVTNITGVGFQNSTDYDVVVENSSEDTCVVDGCRTESINFCHFSQGQGSVTGCTQLQGSDGDFVRADTHAATISGCTSSSGRLVLNYGGVVSNCEFGRDNWISDNADGGAVQLLSVVAGGTYINGPPTKTYRAGFYQREDGVFTGFVDWVNVKDYGATGNGDDDDTVAIQSAIDACFVQVDTPDIDAASAGNSVLYFPHGTYNISDTLNLVGVMGGVIRGGGRFSTIIQQTDDTKSAFRAMGWRGCTVSDLHIRGSGTTDTGTCGFDLDDDGTHVNSSGNSFINVEFGSFDFGLRCGESGNQCSETMVLHCFFGDCLKGWQVNNANCVDNAMIGGGVTECEQGLRIGPNGGNIELVQQVGFANNSDVDLDWRDSGGSVDSPVVVSACRTESVNFIFVSRGHFTVIGCLQTNANPGWFFQNTASDFVTLDNNETVAGKIGIYGKGHVRNHTTTDLVDWYDTGGSDFYYQNICIDRNTTNTFLDVGRVGGDYVIDNALVSTEVIRVNDFAFASLPTGAAGMLCRVNNSNTVVWGAVIAGGGANTVLAFYNGTNWTVAGK